jgi:hypothetical protein
MYSANKQNLFVTIFDVVTSFQNMALEYVNVNVNTHVTALLEHTFYYIIVEDK